MIAIGLQAWLPAKARDGCAVVCRQNLTGGAANLGHLSPPLPCKPDGLLRKSRKDMPAKFSRVKYIKLMGPDPSANPAMSAAPPGPLWLFDGHCGFCSASVQFVLNHDRNGLIRFVSIQSPLGRKIALANGIDPDDPSTFLFVDGGWALRSSDAIIALARFLPWPWRALRAARILPKGLRDRAYALLARNRYRIMGRRETCFVPSEQHKSRFLDEASAE